MRESTVLNSPRVCAVVVVYAPELSCLRRLLTACLSQVAELVVVDNASSTPVQDTLRAWGAADGFTVLGLDENLGVAAAQNRGVAWAREQACSHVLLFDQDSVPAPDMVQQLLSALKDAPASGWTAAVGPRLLDRRTGASTPFVRIGLLGVKKMACAADGDRLIETDFLVSSGMLIPLAVLDRVGLPEEDLFIDNVDLEWCFRARAMGFALYGVCDAVMEHSVGDDVIQIGGWAIHRHGPLRQYYIMRNRILLYRRPYSPRAWVVQDFFRMLFKFALFSLLFSPRRKNVGMMLKGIRDGLKGRSGKFC